MPIPKGIAYQNKSKWKVCAKCQEEFMYRHTVSDLCEWCRRTEAQKARSKNKGER